MRVFVAGAAGVVGRQLIPMLIGAGHDVVGTTRSAERAAWLRAIGAKAVVVDVFDAPSLATAVEEARPATIVHQLTDLAAGFGPEALERNRRLREEGTANLVIAAEAAGASRLVAQSGAWLYADGPMPHHERDPLRSPAVEPDDPTLAGILALERAVLGADRVDGVVLRYGFLYGDGAAAERDATPAPRVSVVAAARAALLAVDGGPPGIYNVVDDGEGVSNLRARRLLGWRP